MTGLKDAKDYAVLKSLEAANAVLEAGDDTDERRDLYAEATRYRAGDSFVRENDTLHIDIRRNSALKNFVDEVETPSPVQRLTDIDYSKEWKYEGIAEGLYDIFDGSDADRVMIHSDEGRYFGPSEGGLASMEAIKKIEEERNIHWETRFAAEEYLWEEAFDEEEQEMWNNWLDQRPRAEQ